MGALFSSQFSLFYLSFSLPFSATKHSFKDENSKDVWLKPLNLEEEGC